VSDAPYLGCPAHCDGVSCLSLSSDHYAGAAGLLLAGTALGSFLTRNTGLIYALAGIYFVVASAIGYRLPFGESRLKREVDADCSTCVPIKSDTRLQGRSRLSEVRLLRKEKNYDDITTRTI
jgi:hypothetical protein